jgi:hypothetical protein
MVYKVEGATPNLLAFWGSVGPRDLKPAVIRAGACGPTAWVGAPCVGAAPTDTPCVGGLVPTVWACPPETLRALVHRGIIRQDNNVKRGRGWPNLTWEDAIKRDLKKWNIPMELCLDRSAWKEAIHVPKPWLGIFPFSALNSLFSYPFSLFLFLVTYCWVSTLAYPNFLGNKRLCWCCCGTLDPNLFELITIELQTRHHSLPFSL